MPMKRNSLLLCLAWTSWTCTAGALDTWTVDHLEKLKADVLRFLPKDVASTDRLRALPLSSPPARQKKIDHVVVLYMENHAADAFFGCMDFARIWWNQGPCHPQRSDESVQRSNQYHLRKSIVCLRKGSKLWHLCSQVWQGRSNKIRTFTRNLSRTTISRPGMEPQRMALRWLCLDQSKFQSSLLLHVSLESLIGYLLPLQLQVVPIIFLRNQQLAVAWLQMFFTLTVVEMGLTFHSQQSMILCGCTMWALASSWTAHAALMGSRVMVKIRMTRMLAQRFLPLDVAMIGVARHKDRFMSQQIFYEQAANGTLPALSWILPPLQACDHPCHDIAKGERILKDVYEALRAGPSWNRTLFFVAYDDAGGFYDHVIPPHEGVPADGSSCIVPGAHPKCGHPFDFRRLGLRTTSMLISPWVGKGVVFQEPRHGPFNTSQFELTSVPATVKNLFNLFFFPNQSRCLGRELWGALAWNTPHRCTTSFTRCSSSSNTLDSTSTQIEGEKRCTCPDCATPHSSTLQFLARWTWISM